MPTKQQPVCRLGNLREGTSFGWPEVPGVVQGTVESKNSCEVTVRRPDGKPTQWGPGTEVVIVRSPAPDPVVPEEKPPLPAEAPEPAQEPRSLFDKGPSVPKRKTPPAGRLRKAKAKPSKPSPKPKPKGKRKGKR